MSDSKAEFLADLTVEAIRIVLDGIAAGMFMAGDLLVAGLLRGVI